VVEPGLTFFTYRSQFSERTSLLLPEISLQGELVLGRLRPFLGGGAGGSLGLSGAGGSGATLHAVGGARVDLSRAWTMLGQMRVRAVRPWTGHTVDFLLGVSRAVGGPVGWSPDGQPPGVPQPPRLLPTSRLEVAGHLGVHVDRTREPDRALTDGSSAMYATSGEASAFAARLGYWVRPTRGLQFDVSHSSNASWQGSTSLPAPGFANRTTYVSARGVVRTSATRRAQLFAAAGPALMIYHGTGENLRTRDADLGGVVEVGGRLHVSNRLAVELALSNYLYGTRYQDQGSVFRHDFLILPGLLYSWP
jgi:hypothetical protein